MRNMREEFTYSIRREKKEEQYRQKRLRVLERFECKEEPEDWQSVESIQSGLGFHNLLQSTLS